MATVEQTPTGPGPGELVPTHHDDPASVSTCACPFPALLWP